MTFTPTSVAIKPRELDPAQYLDSEDAIAEYVRHVLEDNVAGGLTAALKDVIWARSVTQLAKEVDLPRLTVFNALASDHELHADVLFKLLRAMGFQLSVRPAQGRGPG